ncbi:hypothetical protein [Streptomyces lydicus]|uniref:hypothetical protein n=1 Tax=Streptomyces lydicus TaxID=47763 RepID=UPI00099FDC22|nr:hypothetical protein [Streptomyces lydicus]
MERIIPTDNASQPRPGTATPAVGARGPARSRLIALLAASVLAYGLDLGSKLVAVARWEGHEPVDVVGHVAVFNLADSALVCGGALVVLLSFLGASLDGSAPRDRQARGMRAPRWAAPGPKA